MHSPISEVFYTFFSFSYFFSYGYFCFGKKKSVMQPAAAPA